MSKKVTIIGAGIGGLAAASLLAKRGNQVTVFEKNATPGGKMQEIRTDGYRFDTGPSLLTMPFILEKLFSKCEEDIKEFLSLTGLSPLCRYFYPDGTEFDNYSDPEITAQQIKSFAPEDADSYKRFLKYSEDLYNRTADAFLFNPLFSFKDLQDVNIMDIFRINAFSTVSEKVDQYFSSDYLRKFFNRFTTYNGSSPFKAPATLNVIPHVELNLGGYYVKGGLYKVAESLYKMALKKGAEFHFNSEVKSIRVKNRSVESVQLDDRSVQQTDLLVSNSDASETILNLLPEKSVSKHRRFKQKSLEPSCSGFVMLLGCRKKWDRIRHHNIFFSDDYKKEFEDIFDHHVMPKDPTVYIANTSYSDLNDAPENASNLFVLVNAPYLSDNQDWESIKRDYSNYLLNKLEENGLIGLQDSIEYRQIMTPKYFEEKYRSNCGSIYGTSSNSRLSAFLRPRNKVRSISNLYLVGGSTHPGGGIPLVIQSAFNAIELINRE